LTTRELSVAGVRLRVSSELTLVDVVDPFYEPFLTASDAGCPAASTIEVAVLASPPSPNDSPQYFETGGEWMAQRDGDGYRISLFGGGRGEYTMVACANAATDRVSVYSPRPATLPPSVPARVANPLHYPLDQLLLMHHLAPRSGVIVHAAGAVLQGKAFIFPGVSGAGKTTISRLFIAAGLGETLLSDDRVIVRTTRPEGVLSDAALSGRAADMEVWGTPWPGDAQVVRNASAPLGEVLFLVHADRNELVPLSPGVAMRRLVPVISCPWFDRERGNEVLETCARIVESFPCYDLRFRLDEEVVPLICDHARGHTAGRSAQSGEAGRRP
jgi:hypothetical protein